MQYRWRPLIYFIVCCVRNDGLLHGRERLDQTLERYSKIEWEYKEESRTNLSEQFCKEFSSIDTALVLARLILCLPVVCMCVSLLSAK